MFIAVSSIAQDGKLRRDLSSFSGIKVKGSINLVYVPSEKYFVEIVGKQPEDISTEVVDELLVINHKNAKNWVSSEWNTIGKGLIVYVHASGIDEISSTGSGSISIDGILKSDELMLRMDGAGNVSGQINVGKLNLEHNGSANIRLKGGADKAVISSNGSGNIQSFDLVIDECTISKSGSGNAQLTVNHTLHASISGSGNFTYRGNPKEISTSSAGTGKIKQAN